MNIRVFINICGSLCMYMGIYGVYESISKVFWGPWMNMSVWVSIGGY